MHYLPNKLQIETETHYFGLLYETNDRMQLLEKRFISKSLGNQNKLAEECMRSLTENSTSGLQGEFSGITISFFQLLNLVNSETPDPHFLGY